MQEILLDCLWSKTRQRRIFQNIEYFALIWIFLLVKWGFYPLLPFTMMCFTPFFFLWQKQTLFVWIVVLKCKGRHVMKSLPQWKFLSTLIERNLYIWSFKTANIQNEIFFDLLYKCMTQDIHNTFFFQISHTYSDVKKLLKERKGDWNFKWDVQHLVRHFSNLDFFWNI